MESNKMRNLGPLLSDIAEAKNAEVAAQVVPVLRMILTKREGVKIGFDQVCNMTCYSALIELEYADWEEGRYMACEELWKQYH